jgi:riboflavin kinase/FMN adenylyltransferase
MPSESGLPQLDGGAIVTVGTFDGVHRGHRDILRRVADRGQRLGLPTVLVTFAPHPLRVVKPDTAPMLLTPGEEQREVLADTGIERVAVLPFTENLATYSARAFVEHILIGRYHARVLVMGYNHRLGRGREGDSTALAAMGAALGFEVDVVPPTIDDAGTPISSSRIRRAVEAGDIPATTAALGRFYAFRGKVTHGSQRGRDLGYPTLNLVLPSAEKLLPADGVYAVRAIARRGSYGGMMNIGGRPTFGETSRTVEVHLFEATGDWYGADVSVDLVSRLRDTVRFASVDDLVRQLGQDAQAARLALTQA